MQNLTITISTILAVCGGISVIGGAGALNHKWIRPAVKLNNRVCELERKVGNDYKVLHRLDKTNSAQSMAMISLINHMIDGNGIEKMKVTRDKLIEVLAEKE